MAGTAAENEPQTADIEDLLRPHVPFFGPMQVRGLRKGQVKMWCTCGLSPTQPWCDGKSHKGTGFKPLKWVVQGTLIDGREQSSYLICACKYTRAPPFCDGYHIHYPLEYVRRQKECTRDHTITKRHKMCTGCGFAPRVTLRPPNAEDGNEYDSSGSDDLEDDDDDSSAAGHDSDESDGNLSEDELARRNARRAAAAAQSSAGSDQEQVCCAMRASSLDEQRS